MRILHITPSYYPATYWGGPIFSVLGLVQSLSRQPGVQIKVLTTDAAGPRRADRLPAQPNPVAYPPGYEVYFARRIAGASVSAELLWSLPGLVRWADVVHLTGTYSFPTLPTLAYCRLFDKPVVWSPRGALQASYEWKAARNPGLKRVWERLCSALASRDRCVLHVTADTEKAGSLALLPGFKAEIIPNGVDIPPSIKPRHFAPGDVLRLLSIGRLNPKKGLENLFQAMADVSELKVTLKICGTGESDYVSRLGAMAHELGISAAVEFAGHVDGERKSAAFEETDVCVLPSFSENFGMVVAEALAHGLPVIASTATPWAEVEKRQCGLWRDNAPASLAAAIREVAGMDLQAMGLRGRAWMESEFGWDIAARRMLELYESLTTGGNGVREITNTA